MTTTRVSIDHDGNMAASTLANTGDVVSSNDYHQAGLKVSRGMGSITATSADQINDDDLIEIDGMEIKASMARELGLLNRAVDESLSVGAVNRAVQANREAASKTAAPTGDVIADTLNIEIDAGRMSYEEAEVAYTAAGELQLAGLSIDEGLAVIEQVRSGDTFDLPEDHRQVAVAVETKVTAAAVASCRSEIGPEAFSYLQQAATASPEVNEAIRGFAIRRATGRAEGRTWADLYEDVKAHLGR